MIDAHYYTTHIDAVPADAGIKSAGAVGAAESLKLQLEAAERGKQAAEDEAYKLRFAVDDLQRQLDMVRTMHAKALESSTALGGGALGGGAALGAGGALAAAVAGGSHGGGRAGSYPGGGALAAPSPARRSTAPSAAPAAPAGAKPVSGTSFGWLRRGALGTNVMPSTRTGHAQRCSGSNNAYHRPSGDPVVTKRLIRLLLATDAGKGGSALDLCAAIRGQLPRRSPLHESLDALVLELQAQAERQRKMQAQQAQLLQMIAGQAVPLPLPVATAPVAVARRSRP